MIYDTTCESEEQLNSADKTATRHGNIEPYNAKNYAFVYEVSVAGEQLNDQDVELLKRIESLTHEARKPKGAKRFIIEHLEEIEVALKAGVTRKALAEEFNASGYELSEGALANYLGAARRHLNGSSSNAKRPRRAISTGSRKA